MKKYSEYITEGEEGERRPHIRIGIARHAKKAIEKLPDLTEEEIIKVKEAREFFKPIIDWNTEHGYDNKNPKKSDTLTIIFTRAHGTNAVNAPPLEFYRNTSYKGMNISDVQIHNMEVNSTKSMIEFYEFAKNRIKFPKNLERILDLTTYLEDHLKTFELGTKQVVYPADLGTPTYTIKIFPKGETNEEENDEGYDEYLQCDLDIEDLSIINSEIKRISNIMTLVDSKTTVDMAHLSFNFTFSL